MTYVSARNESNAIVLKVNTDRLDAAIATGLKMEILDILATGNVDRVVLDLESVTFVDSSGLGALVSVRKSVPASLQVELRNTNEFVLKVLRLTKMDRVFSF